MIPRFNIFEIFKSPCETCIVRAMCKVECENKQLYDAKLPNYVVMELLMKVAFCICVGVFSYLAIIRIFPFLDCKGYTVFHGVFTLCATYYSLVFAEVHNKDKYKQWW